MTQIERELAEYLRRLLIITGARPFGPTAGPYVGESLAGAGFYVERTAPQGPDAAEWRVVGRLGQDLPGHVQIRARLHCRPDVSDASAAAVAVLLALSTLLAQHRLRHGLEVVVSGGATERSPDDDGYAVPGHYTHGLLVGAISLVGPGASSAPTTVGAGAMTPALAADVRRLLVRYPEARWVEPEGHATPAGLALRVGRTPTDPAMAAEGGGVSRRGFRLREATMLGAEIVALLQTRAPGAYGPLSDEMAGVLLAS